MLAEVSQGTVSQPSGPQVPGPVVQTDTVGRVHTGLHVALTQPEEVATRWQSEQKVVLHLFHRGYYREDDITMTPLTLYKSC